MADDLEEYARKINSKISEEDRWEVYYNISNNRVEQSFAGFTSYYPQPRTIDYTKGFMFRHFMVRYDGGITEVSNKEASRKKSSIPKDLYTYVLIKWRIKDSLIVPRDVNIENATTSDINNFYIKTGSNKLPKALQKVFKEYFTDLEQFKLFTR